MYTTYNHTISCTLSDILEEHMFLWTPQRYWDSEITLSNGTFDPTSNSQVSTMTISPNGLSDFLQMNHNPQTFECRVTMTDANLTASQVITFFSDPSKKI